LVSDSFGHSHRNGHQNAQGLENGKSEKTIGDYLFEFGLPTFMFAVFFFLLSTVLFCGFTGLNGYSTIIT